MVALASVIVKLGLVPEIPVTRSPVGMFVPIATSPTEIVPVTAEVMKVVPAPPLLLVVIAGVAVIVAEMLYLFAGEGEYAG